MCLRLASIGVALFSLCASSAHATPKTYAFDWGVALITATRTSDDSVVFSTFVDLDGSFVTIDSWLDDFSITTTGSSTIAAEQLWGGYDSFVIESAYFWPSSSYDILTVSVTGSGTIKYYALGVSVSVYYTAFNSEGPPPPIINNTRFVVAPQSTRFNAEVDSDSSTLTLWGLVSTRVYGATFGEPDDLVLETDFVFTGTAVPEPAALLQQSTGLLILMGLAARHRRRHREGKTASVSIGWDQSVRGRLGSHRFTRAQ